MKLENNEICRIVDGDEIAFNRFMEHYSSRLYHYTFALLGQKESAEEIVSDVFFEEVVYMLAEQWDEVMNQTMREYCVEKSKN